MPERCVAGFCSNARKDGVSLFRFPKNPELHARWTKQVQRTRDKWSPTPHSVVCSDHFDPDCFDFVPDLKRGLGLTVQHKKALLDSAVPTIFPRRGSKPSGPESKGKRSTALEKRLKLEVIPEVLHEVRCREEQQQIHEIKHEASSDRPEPEERSCSIVELSVKKCDAATQASRRPATGGVACPQFRHQGVQTESAAGTSISTQTDVTQDCRMEVGDVYPARFPKHRRRQYISRKVLEKPNIPNILNLLAS